MATPMAPKHVGEPIVRLSLGSTFVDIFWCTDQSRLRVRAMVESKLGKENGIGTVK